MTSEPGQDHRTDQDSGYPSSDLGPVPAITPAPSPVVARQRPRPGTWIRFRAWPLNRMVNKTDIPRGPARDDVERVRRSYDDVPYVESVFPQLDPASLGASALLGGALPASPDHCKVLELGCGHGLTLIALAEKYPQSHFTGIDLASTQIDHGRTIASEAGIGNVQLETADITDPALRSRGRFDYILAHGVWSWVPVPVQDAMLEVCSGMLAENGIAFISYNTLPGWHALQPYRDIAMDMAQRRDSPAAGLELAVRFLRTMHEVVNSLPRRSDRLALQGVMERFRGRPAGYLLHEFMENHNRPEYFRQFVDRAARGRLQYLGEAGFADNFNVARLPASLASLVRELARDPIDAGQLWDYLVNTRFRSSLLVRAGSRLEPMQAEKVAEATALYCRLGEPRHLDLGHGTGAAFRFGRQTLSPTTPASKALLSELSRARNPLPWRELVQRVRARLRAAGMDDPAGSGKADTGQMLAYATRLARREVIKLSLPAPAAQRAAERLPERPTALRLARWMARHGNAPVNLSPARRRELPAVRALLSRCDGTRSVDSLVSEATELAEGGKLALPGVDSRLRGRNHSVEEAVRRILQRMVEHRYLVEPP